MGLLGAIEGAVGLWGYLALLGAIEGAVGLLGGYLGLRGAM